MAKEQRGSKRSTRGVLDNHRRVGKRLKSPLHSLPHLRETSYVDEVLPEIIHIAMMMDAYGYRDGIRLCESLFEAIKPYAEHSHMPFLSHLRVSEADAPKVVAALRETGSLTRIQIANAPLCILPEWPLSFLGQSHMERSEAISRLQGCVGRVLDKFETPACAALGMVMYWQGVSGKLFYVNGVEPPDLNAMISDPGSPAAQMAKSHVRASTMAFWGLEEDQGGIGRGWADKFWQECFKLAPCSVETDDDAN